MTQRSIIFRSLHHFLWSNLAVMAGVVVATAVLTGALMVGDSVRGSLRDLTIQRLGPIDDALIAPRFFDQSLADRIANTPGFAEHFTVIYPAIFTRGGTGAVDNQNRTAGVQIAAILGDWIPVPNGNCILNTELAGSLPDVKQGDSLLFSLPIASGSPLDATLSRRSREDVTSNLRANVSRIASAPGVASMFNLSGGQRLPRNAWMNLADLQGAMGQDHKVNALLVQAKGGAIDELQKVLKTAINLADYGLSSTISHATGESVMTTSDTYFLKPLIDSIEKAAAQTHTPIIRVSSYLTNTAADSNGQTIHYAMIAGLSSLNGNPISDEDIILNQWAADHLHAKVGDAIKLDYYLRDHNGGTHETSSPLTFHVSQIISMTGIGADATLTPVFRGLTDSDSVSDWHAPEGITIRKEWVTPDDDAYWKKYKAAPKLLISLNAAKRLWSGPFGEVTSVRVPMVKAAEFQAELRNTIDPAAMGLTFRPIKAEQLAATSGSTDFSGLFIGFSFFLIASAVLLVAMLFRLNIEQRARQLGLMAALGFRGKILRRMAMSEGLLIATLGATVGTAVAIGYTALMMLGLRTWWVGAVGTTAMRLHIEAMTLLYGFIGSVVIALLAIGWGIWRVGKTSPTTLLAGGWGSEFGIVHRHRWIGWIGWFLTASAIAMLCGLLGRSVDPETVLSGGAILLIGLLTVIGANLRPGRTTTYQSVASMGFRNISRHSARSMVTMSLIALATFALVIVASLRGQAGEEVGNIKSGAGGYCLMLTADVPLTGDLNTRPGRAALEVSNVDDPLWSQAHFTSMRRWRGEDISCLNLMKPGSPTILSVPQEMIQRNAFTFAHSVKKVENVWTLLNDTDAAKGGVGVITDDETAQYILHLGLGESLTITDQTGMPRKLTLVATLAGSVYQGELLMGENNFAQLFPSQGGTSVVMIETSPADAQPISQLLGRELGDFSVTVDPTAEVLARYQNVKNTYMATFQVLGSLGLLLGTVGLAVVLLRGVIERRSELAMLAAIGFKRIDRIRMVLAENVLLLILGLGIGTICALTGTLPALAHSAQHLHLVQLLLTLTVILFVGIGSLIIAVWIGARKIGSRDLRSE